MSVQDRLQKYLAVERIGHLYERIRASFIEKGPIAHNWDHIYRDVVNAVVIGEGERANMDIVVPATILHDVGFLYSPNPSEHHTIGSERCGEWLSDWSYAEQKQIAGCILTHKGKMQGFTLEPTTLDEKVVCDADMMEKMGWIGLMQSIRTFVEFAQSGRPQYKSLYEIAKVIAETVDLRLHTFTGRCLALERGGYIQAEVCSRALEELKFYP